MQRVLDALPEGAAVVVIRLRSLGDCVLTTPALHLLKNARPDLGVAVVVEDRFAPVFRGNPDVAAVLPPSVAHVRRWRPALAINFHGGGRSLVLSTLSGAHFRAGFAHYRAPGVYNVRIPRAQEILGVERKVHTAEHLASAMFYLGVRPAPIPRARLFAQPERRPRPYAVVHPFAAAPEKTWSASRFAEMARRLHVSHGLDIIILAGPGEDPSPFAEFECAAGLSLERVQSLIAGASLFLGNDSGPAHIAAAFGIPVVVLFGPSDPVVWAPWQVDSQVLTAPGPIDSIEVEEVLRAAGRLRVLS